MASGSNDTQDRQRVCFRRDCDKTLATDDPHTVCMFCLGLEHARQAFETPGFCPCCLALSTKDKGRRLARVSSHQRENASVPSGSGGSDLRASLNRPVADPWPPLPTPGGRPIAKPSSTATKPRPTPVATVTTATVARPRSRPTAAVTEPRTGPTPAPRVARKRPPSPRYERELRAEAPVPAKPQPAPRRPQLAASFTHAWNDRAGRARSPDTYYTTARDGVPRNSDREVYPPPRFHDSWGEDMDDVDPQEELPSYQDPQEDYRVLDEVYSNGEEDNYDQGDLA